MVWYPGSSQVMFSMKKFGAFDDKTECTISKWVGVTKLVGLSDKNIRASIHRGLGKLKEWPTQMYSVYK